MFRFYEAWRVDLLDPPETLRNAQAWVRDTTNRAKADQLGRIARDQTHPMSAAAESLWRDLLTVEDPNTREYHQPYHLGAFIYMGA